MKKGNQWKFRSKKTVFQHSFLSLESHNYVEESKDISYDFAILDLKHAANALVIDDQKQALFVRQYRYGSSVETVEVPGGIIEPNETPQQAVIREVKEETGYETKVLNYTGWIYSNPVFQTNRIHHFLLKTVGERGTQNLDSTEEIELIKISLAEVFEKASNGFFRHPHTLTCLFFAKKYLTF